MVFGDLSIILAIMGIAPLIATPVGIALKMFKLTYYIIQKMKSKSFIDDDGNNCYLSFQLYYISFGTFIFVDIYSYILKY